MGKLGMEEVMTLAMIGTHSQIRNVFGLYDMETCEHRIPGIPGGCASVGNAPLSLEARYIPHSYCFLSFFGLSPYFISLSFDSVVNSLYSRACIVDTHPFVLWSQAEILFFILSC